MRGSVNLVRLTLATTPLDGEMIQSLLETERIESVRKQTDFGSGSTDGWGGQQEILVRHEDLEPARELLGEPQ